MGNLASELSDVHEGFRQRLARIFEEWRSTLTEALRRGQENGRISEECQPATVAQFLVASLEGAILLAKVAKDITVMEKCVDQLKQHLRLYAKS